MYYCASPGDYGYPRDQYPFHLEHPSHLSPHSTPLTSNWGLVWVPWVIQLMSIGYLFFILWHMLTCCSLNTSHRLLSLLAISISQFLMSVSRLSAVQFSRSVMYDSLQPHKSQHARPPCHSPTPGLYSNSCPLSWWCHPAISSSVVPFCSCLQSLPASGSFPMGQFFSSGGRSIGASASTSVLPMNTQDWSPLGWTGWISLKCKGLSGVFSNTTVQKHHSSVLSFLYSPTLTSIHDHWRNHSLD